VLTCEEGEEMGRKKWEEKNGKRREEKNGKRREEKMGKEGKKEMGVPEKGLTTNTTRLPRDPLPSTKPISHARKRRKERGQKVKKV
jgi:hypothetical protein